MTQPSNKSKLSESEFLRLQAEQAKVNVQRALNDAKAALAKGIDPRPVARKHPWISIASAAVAGFVAAVVAIPSKEEMEVRRAERLRRAMNPDPPRPPAAATNGKDQKAAEKISLGALLVKELIQLIRPVLMAAITASVKAGANPPVASNPPPPEPPRPDNPL
jgi:hypothetical protein